MTDYPAGYPPPPPPGPPAQPPRWSAGAQRVLTVAMGEVRVALLQVIRELGFAVTGEQYGLLEAERGSKLRGLSLTQSRVPAALRVQLTPDGGGARVEITVEDRWGGTGRTPAAVAVYAEVFTEVLTAMDDRLTQVDAAAAASFDTWWRVLPEGQVAAGAAGAANAARLEASLSRRSSRVLDGPRSGSRSPTGVANVGAVTLAVPGLVAELAADTFDGLLTAGQLVASSPGSMPSTLVEHLRRVLLLLEQRVVDHRQAPVGSPLRIELAIADKPVLAFLFQQAALREKLPVRMLFTCTTCRLDRIMNPEFVAQRERNRRVRVLQTSVGAVVGTSHISPFILFGRLAQLKKVDPDHVCARCQGTDADQRPVTFCSRCGTRLDTSVLRTCPTCKLDLRTLLAEVDPWRPVEAEPAADDFGTPTLVTSGETAGTEPVTESVTDPAPGWYPDPYLRHEVRWFDGLQWTVHVGAGGVTFVESP